VKHGYLLMLSLCDIALLDEWSMYACMTPLFKSVTWLKWIILLSVCGNNAETPDFISPQDWPPNSPDLNPVDYAIWTSLPLPDPWRRPSERTTDWRVASIWSEQYWQSSEPVAWSTAPMCPCKRGTLWTSVLTDIDCAGNSWLVSSVI